MHTNARTVFLKIDTLLNESHTPPEKENIKCGKRAKLGRGFRMPQSKKCAHI